MAAPLSLLLFLLSVKQGHAYTRAGGGGGRGRQQKGLLFFFYLFHESRHSGVLMPPVGTRTLGLWL